MHKEPILLFDSKSKTIVSNVNRTPENSKSTEPRKPVQTLQSPPKVTSPCEEWSEMQKAVFQGDGEEVKKIIDDSEIGINAPVAEGLPLAGWTPIQIAALKGNYIYFDFTDFFIFIILCFNFTYYFFHYYSRACQCD